MLNQIVECVPNFSEGRRLNVIQSICDQVTSVQEVYLINRHSDKDHNRTVLTFVGSCESVSEAAFNSIKTAAKLIDMNQHTGEHPRIGSTDVVPFIPIKNVDMQECIILARELGKRVADELGIPVYLYEEAATKPERRNLEYIRKGQFEGLRQEISENLDREPDFGPKIIGSAGATVIGARYPLIAFNVFLNSSEVDIAHQIARVIRHSSGGLRYVKAMGMFVEDRAQVSMNLTNYKRTSIARVVELIRTEALRLGTSIHHCELVGMIPQDALIDAGLWYLQLTDFKPDQILEKKLSDILPK
jgi:glutamate formiminotransferase / formiminotetrahydrofolate cyclodeaminase